MRCLHRKLFRDLRRMKGQVLAIALVVACAVGAQIAASSTALSVATAVARYYEKYRFPDVFAKLRRAPDSLAARLREIPGVAAVETRIVTDAAIGLGEFNEPMRAQVTSVPLGAQPGLSQLQLSAGRLIAPGADDEALVSPGFFNAHHLHLGDRLDVTLDGRRQSFQIVGIALSPENIYSVRPGELVPDEVHNAVLFVGRDALGAAMDLKGAFNNVVLRLATGVRQSEALAQMDRVLDPYGGTGARGRDRHASAKFLADKTLQLQKQAAVTPLLFFGVAAYLLSFLLSRVVANQRQDIGTLRALGFTRREVAVHYLTMAVAIVALGVAVGVPLGARLGAALSAKYALMFRIPDLVYRLDVKAVLTAIGASLVFGLLGASSAVRRAAKLEPAEAMRPTPPASFQRSSMERWLGDLLPLTGRMALRNLARRPLRSVLSSFGIAAASATIVTGAFFFDVVNYVVALQFGVASRQNVTVTLTDPRAGAAIDELRRLPGVIRVEPFRQVSAVIRNGHWYRDVGILGLSANPELFRPVTAAGKVAQIPPDGLVLSSRLAEALHVTVGQPLLVDSQEAMRPRLAVTVAAVVDDTVGLSSYASLDSLCRWLGEDKQVTGAYLRVAGPGDTLYRRLQSFPKVAGASLKTAEAEAFRSTSGGAALLLAGVFAMFGVVMATGVVYSAARASFAERERELATLRLIGFTRSEVLAISLMEISIQVLVSLPVGALCGRGFAALLAVSTRTDVLRMPVVVSSATYLLAAGLVVVSTVAVGFVVRRWVKQLDLPEVLKSRE